MTPRRAAALLALVSSSAVALARAAAPPPARPTIIYVGGRLGPGQAVARIDVRGPGTRGHSLEVMHAYGPQREATGYCSAPSYWFGEDAELIELRPGAYKLTAKAERLSPPSAFPALGDVTVEGGRCYAPVMTCDGDVVDGAACRLSLAPKSCAPLRSARRIFLETVVGC